MADNKQWGFETKGIHVGQDPAQWKSRAVMPPISLSTNFELEAPGKPYAVQTPCLGSSINIGYDYSRTANPTRCVLEACLASLESTKYALTYSSGLAAIHNVTHLLNPGDHVLSFNDIYGGTDRLFRQMIIPRGFEVSFCDVTDPKVLETALRPTTKLVWLESPSNPSMKVVDIKAVSDLVKRKVRNAIVAVDNTFMSSHFQKPVTLGADLSVHSITKYMSGHSDVLMGAICTNNQELEKKLRFFQNAAGAVPSPFDCFLANRGLKTLHVRMERHMENGLKVANFLEKSPLVLQVNHPGLKSHPQHEIAAKQMTGYSGMVSFCIKGGIKEATKFLKNLKIFILAESLGGVESLASLPVVMSHASMPPEERKLIGIDDNLIRLSVGIESATDLIADLDQALKKAVGCQ